MTNNGAAFTGNLAGGVADPPALRPSGSIWSATATASLTATAGIGRFHRGSVNVVAGSTTLASAEARFLP